MSVAATVCALSAPATAADSRDCSSDQLISRVHRGVEGAIRQLQHDRSDVDGHRAAAIADMEAARRQLDAARRYADSRDPDDWRCFRIDDENAQRETFDWDDRHDSRHNTWAVRRWTEAIIDRLQSDRQSFGGHRQAAIDDLEHAREQLRLALGDDDGRRLERF